jgi:hypothetical protein
MSGYFHGWNEKCAIHLIFKPNVSRKLEFQTIIDAPFLFCIQKRFVVNFCTGVPQGDHFPFADTPEKIYRA